MGKIIWSKIASLETLEEVFWGNAKITSDGFHKLRVQNFAFVVRHRVVTEIDSDAGRR